MNLEFTNQLHLSEGLNFISEIKDKLQEIFVITMEKVSSAVREMWASVKSSFQKAKGKTWFVDLEIKLIIYLKNFLKDLKKNIAKFDEEGKILYQHLISLKDSLEEKLISNGFYFNTFSSLIKKEILPELNIISRNLKI